MSSNAKRTRDKPCNLCGALPDELFRIRYEQTNGEWVFACASCRRLIEQEDPTTYQYGGTWKRHKRH